MKHMEERCLENCRTYDYHKPVTPLFIAVALGRQDAERDKVAVIWTGNLMRSQRLQTLVGKSGPQARSQTSTPLEEVLNLLHIAQNITSAWPWIPMMRAGRPVTAAQWVPHRSPATGLPPTTGERFRPKQGGKAPCL